MVKYKYGDFENQQFKKAKEKIRKQIFFLLLIVDDKTKDDYSNINVEKAFQNVFNHINGMNEILFYPAELVRVVSLLESALSEYKSDSFNFEIYRKLILDAGCEILNVKEE